jgi:ATP-dependent Clp protease ATP-binding subunit ClpB
MGAIVDIQAQSVRKLLKDRKIDLVLSEGARAWLARVGYDPVYGARPLKRAIQKHLVDPLAELLLAGSVPDGATVTATDGDGQLLLAVSQ